MMTRKTNPLLGAVALATLVACGSSGPNSDLKAVFFRNVTPAPVATLTLQRQNGAPMDKAQARFDTRVLFDGWMKVGSSRTATVNTSGVAAIALTSGNYPMLLDPKVSQATALVGKLNDTLSIAQDLNRTYQTSQQTWTVTAPVAFSAVEIVVYQVDADGKAMFGTENAPLDPVVLTANVTAGSASVQFSTELFKGSYRAVISATPATATDNIAPFETPVFAAAGGGAVEPQNVTLSSGGNVVSLHFMEAGAPLADSQIGSIVAYDAGSLVYLGSATSSGGVATVSTGTVSNVIVMVESPDGQTMAAGAYTASPTHSATLTRYTVAGHVKPAGGASLTASGTGSYGQVEAALQTSLGGFWDERIASSPLDASIADALGTYQMKLFAGSWRLQAVSLHNLPSSAAAGLNVSADVAAQDINVDPGGVISGNVQDQAHNNIAGIEVSVYDGNHLRVGSASTDSSGNYTVAVPFGNFMVVAGGALTKDVSVSSGAATRTLNLTRFQVTGRLTDTALGPVAGRVTWGNGSANATTLGTYTINVVQGLNWFLFTPPSTSPSLGFAYETNVLVNADTVKVLQ